MHAMSFLHKRAHLSAMRLGREMLERVPAMTPARFDLWFNAATPVDTSGDPDDTINYVQDGAYWLDVLLSSTKYVAVRAATSGDVYGPVQEVQVTIPTSSLDSPGAQYSDDSPEYYPVP